MTMSQLRDLMMLIKVSHFNNLAKIAFYLANADVSDYTDFSVWPYTVYFGLFL